MSVTNPIPPNLNEATEALGCKNLIRRLEAVGDLSSCNAKIPEVNSILAEIKTWEFGKTDLQFWLNILKNFNIIFKLCGEASALNKWQLNCDRDDFSLEILELLMRILKFSYLLLKNSSSIKSYPSMELLADLLRSSKIEIVMGVLNFLEIISIKCFPMIVRSRKLLLQLLQLTKKWGGKQMLCISDICQKSCDNNKKKLNFEFIRDSNDPVSVNVNPAFQVPTSKLSMPLRRLIEEHNVPEYLQEQFAIFFRLAHHFLDFNKRILCIQARLTALRIFAYGGAYMISILLKDCIAEELLNVADISDSSLKGLKTDILKTLAVMWKKESSSRKSISSKRLMLSEHLQKSLKNFLGTPECFQQSIPASWFHFLQLYSVNNNVVDAISNSDLNIILMEGIRYHVPTVENAIFAAKVINIIDFISNGFTEPFLTDMDCINLVKRLEFEVDICVKEQVAMNTTVNSNSDDETTGDGSNTIRSSCAYERLELLKSIFTMLFKCIETGKISFKRCDDELIVTIDGLALSRDKMLALKHGKNKKLRYAAVVASRILPVYNVIQDAVFNPLQEIILNYGYYDFQLFLLCAKVTAVFIRNDPKFYSLCQEKGLIDMICCKFLSMSMPSTTGVLESLPTVFGAVLQCSYGAQYFISCYPFTAIFNKIAEPFLFSTSDDYCALKSIEFIAKQFGISIDCWIKQEQHIENEALTYLVEVLSCFCCISRQFKRSKISNSVRAASAKLYYEVDDDDYIHSTRTDEIHSRHLVKRLTLCVNRNEYLQELFSVKEWSYGKTRTDIWKGQFLVLEHILKATQNIKNGNSSDLNKRELVQDLLANLLFLSLIVENCENPKFCNSLQCLLDLLTSENREIVIAALELFWVYSKQSNLRSQISRKDSSKLHRKLLVIAMRWKCGSGNVEQHEPNKILENSICGLNFHKYGDSDAYLKMRTHGKMAENFSESPTNIKEFQLAVTSLATLLRCDIINEVKYFLENGLLTDIAEVLELEGEYFEDVKIACLRFVTSLMHKENVMSLMTMLLAPHPYHHYNCYNVFFRLSMHCIDSIKNALFAPMRLKFTKAVLSLIYHLVRLPDGLRFVNSWHIEEYFSKLISGHCTDVRHLSIVTKLVRIITSIFVVDPVFSPDIDPPLIMYRLQAEIKVCYLDRPPEVDLSKEDRTNRSQKKQASLDEKIKLLCVDLDSCSGSNTTNEAFKRKTTQKSVFCLPERVALLKSLLNFLLNYIRIPPLNQTFDKIQTSIKSLKHIIMNPEYYGSSLFSMATRICIISVQQAPELFAFFTVNGIIDDILRTFFKKQLPASNELLATLSCVLDVFCRQIPNFFADYKPYERVFGELVSTKYFPSDTIQTVRCSIMKAIDNFASVVNDLFKKPFVQTELISPLLNKMVIDVTGTCLRATSMCHLRPTHSIPKTVTDENIKNQLWLYENYIKKHSALDATSALLKNNITLNKEYEVARKKILQEIAEKFFKRVTAATSELLEANISEQEENLLSRNTVRSAKRKISVTQTHQEMAAEKIMHQYNAIKCNREQPKNLDRVENIQPGSDKRRRLNDESLNADCNIQADENAVQESCLNGSVVKQSIDGLITTRISSVKTGRRPLADKELSLQLCDHSYDDWSLTLRSATDNRRRTSNPILHTRHFLPFSAVNCVSDKPIPDCGSEAVAVEELYDVPELSLDEYVLITEHFSAQEFRDKTVFFRNTPDISSRIPFFMYFLETQGENHEDVFIVTRCTLIVDAMISNPCHAFGVKHIETLVNYFLSCLEKTNVSVDAKKDINVMIQLIARLLAKLSSDSNMKSIRSLLLQYINSYFQEEILNWEFCNTLFVLSSTMGSEILKEVINSNFTKLCQQLNNVETDSEHFRNQFSNGCAQIVRNSARCPNTHSLDFKRLSETEANFYKKCVDCFGDSFKRLVDSR